MRSQEMQSEKFREAWRYSIESDFTDPTGEPVKYAQGGKRNWGEEQYCIPLPKQPFRASANSDASLIAIAVEYDIYVYDTVAFEQLAICKGHASKS
jgi:hypothetical protein